MKRGRLIGSKYKNPQTRKWAKRKDNPNEDVETLKRVIWYIWFVSSRRTDQVPETYENKEISISYEWNEMEPKMKVNVDDVFL